MNEVLAFAKSMNKGRTTLGAMKISFVEILKIIERVDPSYNEKQAKRLVSFQ
jgi:hypothetical protein